MFNAERVEAGWGGGAEEKSGERARGPEVGQGGSAATKAFSERKEGWVRRETFNKMKRAREREGLNCGGTARAWS